MVKSGGDERVGPGPNYFADGPDAVWVDPAGRLHLRIQFKHGRWWAAEVASVDSLAHGTYQFHLDTALDDLDPNVVLGFFTWSDAPDFAHREIDIELGRWGQETGDLGQCVVQPYDRAGNLVRFSLPPGVRSSIHSFTWAPDTVVCEVGARGRGSHGRPESMIHRHLFTSGVPEPGGENARINLWLLGGEAPRRERDVEVVVGRFEFRPLSSSSLRTPTGDPPP